VFHTTAMRSLHVGIVELGFEGVPEEDQHVDLAGRDERTELLVAAEGAAAQAGDVEVELVTQQPAGRARRQQIVTGEEFAIEAGPVEQIRLLVVVGDQG
jgi:hypothetical protein